LHGNPKLQIPNHKQIPNLEIQNSKHVLNLGFWSFNIVWKLALGIWCFRAERGDGVPIEE